MPEALDSSESWKVDGRFMREGDEAVEGAAIDLFMDEFCVLLDRHRLRFSGCVSPMTQAQIDGEDDAAL